MRRAIGGRCVECGHESNVVTEDAAPASWEGYCIDCKTWRRFVEVLDPVAGEPRREPRRELLYPVQVEGTAIAHLARSVFDDDGAGYRAICPAGPLITRPLLLIRADAAWLWCGACGAWAEAAGVVLPTPTDDPPGAG